MLIEFYFLALVALVIIALYGMGFALHTCMDVLDVRMDVLSERIKRLEDGRVKRD